LGIIDAQTLKNYGRHAIVAIFVVSAILTPPDVLSQLLMAGPLLLLYGLSILILSITKTPVASKPMSDKNS
jgi:sec-independent protein translocase protein TatC